jgi:hypothetical protein
VFVSYSNASQTRLSCWKFITSNGLFSTEQGQTDIITKSTNPGYHSSYNTRYHITFNPLIGKLYDLDNSIKFAKLFENKVGTDKISIIGETWILPDEELEKFKGRPNVYRTLLEYTFFKNIFIYCNGEKMSIDMDTLTTNPETNEHIEISEISRVDQMYSIRRKRNIPNAVKNNVLQRMVRILGKDINVILRLQSDVSLNDRNSITISIEGMYEITKENYTGALIYESMDHQLIEFSY